MADSQHQNRASNQTEHANEHEKDFISDSDENRENQNTGSAIEPSASHESGMATEGSSNTSVVTLPSKPNFEIEIRFNVTSKLPFREEFSMRENSLKFLVPIQELISHLRNPTENHSMFFPDIRKVYLEMAEKAKTMLHESYLSRIKNWEQVERLHKCIRNDDPPGAFIPRLNTSVTFAFAKNNATISEMQSACNETINSRFNSYGMEILKTVFESRVELEKKLREEADQIEEKLLQIGAAKWEEINFNKCNDIDSTYKVLESSETETISISSVVIKEAMQYGALQNIELIRKMQRETMIREEAAQKRREADAKASDSTPVEASRLVVDAVHDHVQEQIHDRVGEQMIPVNQRLERLEIATNIDSRLEKIAGSVKLGQSKNGQQAADDNITAARRTTNNSNKGPLVKKQKLGNEKHAARDPKIAANLDSSTSMPNQGNHGSTRSEHQSMNMNRGAATNRGQKGRQNWQTFPRGRRTWRGSGDGGRQAGNRSLNPIPEQDPQNGETHSTMPGPQGRNPQANSVHREAGPPSTRPGERNHTPQTGRENMMEIIPGKPPHQGGQRTVLNGRPTQTTTPTTTEGNGGLSAQSAAHGTSPERQANQGGRIPISERLGHISQEIVPSTPDADENVSLTVVVNGAPRRDVKSRLQLRRREPPA